PMYFLGSREPALRYYSSSCAPVITGAQLCGVAATIRAGYVQACRQKIQSSAGGFREQTTKRTDTVLNGRAPAARGPKNRQSIPNPRIIQNKASRKTLEEFPGSLLASTALQFSSAANNSNPDTP